MTLMAAQAPRRLRAHSGWDGSSSHSLGESLGACLGMMMTTTTTSNVRRPRPCTHSSRSPSPTPFSPQRVPGMPFRLQWAPLKHLSPRVMPQASSSALFFSTAPRPSLDVEVEQEDNDEHERGMATFSSPIHPLSLAPQYQLRQKSDQPHSRLENAAHHSLTEPQRRPPTAMNRSTIFKASPPPRPRLQQLRQQLRREPTKDHESLVPLVSLHSQSVPPIPVPSTQPPPTTSTIAPPTLSFSKAIQSSSGSSCSKSNGSRDDTVNVVDWKAVASHLPDPPPLSSSLSASLLPNKMSTVMTDRFGRSHTYLRLSLTERCNLRCVYCMPADGVTLQPSSHLLSTDELLQLAQHFVANGVNKFRVTGGEPTLRPDLLDLLQGLSQLLRDAGHGSPNIGMTTNGVTLARNLEAYVTAGLSSVNISLDTLQPARFATLTRRPAHYLDRVLRAVDVATQVLPTTTSSEETGSSRAVKLNCVVMRGTNHDEVASIVQWQLSHPDRRQHLAVRFIEYMPFTANGWDRQLLVPYQELLQQAPFRVVPAAHLDHPETDEVRTSSEIRLRAMDSGDPHDTTKWYHATTNDRLYHVRTDPSSPTRVSTIADGRDDDSALVGFITSMSQHFCAGCNRLRLGTDGSLKVCLFDGATELSLRDALRQQCTPSELNRLIHAAVQKKHFKLGGHPDPEAIHADSINNKPMTLIGG